MRPLVVLDRPAGRAIANISEGEQVRAITGEVITHPVRFQRGSDYLYRDEVRAGAAIYLLHPVGEGYWLVWYRGKIVSIEAYDCPDVRYEWWAKMRSGYPLPIPFTGVDDCS